MRVLIAPTGFADRLSAHQAAQAIATGWAEHAPHDQLATCPLSDGGAGFVDVVLTARGGDLRTVTVGGPLGDPVPAALLLVGEPDGGTTAYVETAHCCGPHLLEPGPDALRATSRGVGELLLAALDAGVSRIVVGVGDTASHDAGAGLLTALGVGDAGTLGRGGAGLADLPDGPTSGLAAARERFRGVELVAATASDLPLLGFHGASATDAGRRGASVEQAQQLESAFGRFADLAQRSLVAGRPLSGPGLAAQPGAGAGGGIGFALLLLGARRVDGVAAALDAVGFVERLPAHDLVVTGEATFGWQSLHGGVVAQVAAAALEVGLPVVVVALEVEVGRRETLNLGVSGAYAALGRGQSAPDAPDVLAALTARSRRVARTWSR